jgi:predicted nucleic acid-binding protein
MRYVLDSCVALKWVLPESDSDKAIQVRDDANAGIHELLAPDILLVEVAHALARAERRGIIRPPEGARRLQNISNNSPALHSYLSLLPRAFAIASQFRVGVYDCLYVALAERERCKHLTADDRLIRALQLTFPFITSLASLP